ncbi:protein ANTAGONIST OF LIKE HETEROCHROMATIN PROTEIN 1-like [Actinidia eriantha]|uniref:protein ANTAGONIST OF LIKE HETEROCHROMATIN PROTEIN 1-like n=1 Tax=Actinidia eriantha TaxID=165200 RepID=UPI00258BD7BC|nr:protein ANTAGONIST OF LIKE HETEROCHROMATIN PROTEIN 1-like [Actinidia eriantha]
MPPLKKTKKPRRDSKKLKKRRSVNSGPAESKAIDSDWWENFWHKNSPISGSNVISDEEEGFKYFFRVSKKTFDYICSLVRLDLVSRPPSGLINIEGRLLSVEKQVAIALRRLASGESQVSVGASFGVGQSTVSQVTWRFIEALEERAKHHLKWPDSNKMQEIKSKFEASFGLPNCCGAIDATHIVMTLPAVETSDDWCDQEKNYSMFLQVIVDDEMRFLDIVTGWPGRMPISRMLKCSGFYKLCYSGNRLNGNARTNSERAEIREFIVGGVNYPLLSWLITPYESSGLSAAESEFNAIHEAARSLAMKALAQLKGSWRILNKVMWRPDKQKLPSIILVCCLLHNIIIDSGDNLRPGVALLGHHDLGYTEQCCKQVDPLGRTTRENLVQHLQLSKQKALPN